MEGRAGFRPLRWVGVAAAAAVVSGSLAVLAWEAISDSIVFVGDTSSDEAPLVGDGFSVDGELTTYVVEPGDTGTGIARRLYGRQDVWPQIAELNDLSPTATLDVGQELQVPVDP